MLRGAFLLQTARCCAKYKGNNRKAAMALPSQKQFQYWTLATAVVVFLLWALGDVLTPFILGALLPFVLIPLPIASKNGG